MSDGVGDVSQADQADASVSAGAAGGAQVDEQLNRALATALDKGRSRYQPDDFRAELGAMNDADKARLLDIVNSGQVSVKDAATMVDQFQQYYGYDNQAAASALREAYYPELLDPFIQGAGQVNESALDLDRGAHSGNAESKSDAALAQAVFKLSRQGENYTEEAVRITGRINGENQSIGFDHLIAGLDGRMHAQTDGPEGAVLRTGVSALGGNPGEIRSVDAVTWLGDVAATVQIGAQQLADPQRVGERMQSRSLLEQILMAGNSVNAEKLQQQIAPAASAGWAKEAPLEDRLGDVIGVGLQPDPNGHNLGATIASAFDPQSEAFQQRYRNYADDVGLRYDPATGSISDADKQAFVDRFAPNVDALGTGLFTKGQAGAVAAFPEVLGATRDLARINLDRWVEDIEAGLRNEIRR